MVKHAEIAREIMDYLSARAEKRDTLEGIITWLQRSDKGGPVAHDVEMAVNALLEKGELEEIREKKEVIHYRVKK
jgi:hypothetical protein